MKKLFALLLVLLAIPAFALGDVCEYAARALNTSTKMTGSSPLLALDHLNAIPFVPTALFPEGPSL